MAAAPDPAYITIKFQKVNHHRRPAQAQRRRAKDIAPSQAKKKPEVSLRLFSFTLRYALGHIFVLRHRVAEAFGHAGQIDQTDTCLLYTSDAADE